MPSIHPQPLRSCAAALVLLTLFAAAALTGTSASAQTQPTITLGNAPAVLEGNTGTRVMRFPITLDAATSRQVSGRFITRVSTLSSSATAGSSCTGEADYIAVDQPFTIAANTLSTSVDVVVCGDTRTEPAEEIVYVALTSVFGAVCTTTSCTAGGRIVEDDIPGTLTINSASVSRFSFSRTITVPVRLSFPFGVPMTVNYSTANGTAQGVSSCPAGASVVGSNYVTTSGTVTFQPGETTANLSIRICGSFSPDEETFTVALSSPSAPATIFRGRATITLLPAQIGKVGVFGFSPDDARIPINEPSTFALEWTLPPGQVWRHLNNIGLRVRGDKKMLLWVNWNESSNLFSLCQRRGVRMGAYQFYGQGSEADLDDDDGDDRQTLAVSCSEGALPGSNTVLETRHARLHLNNTQVLGSGPTGASVLLNMSISFKASARGKARVELAASSDDGLVESFARAASLKVVRHADD